MEAILGTQSPVIFSKMASHNALKIQEILFVRI